MLYVDGDGYIKQIQVLFLHRPRRGGLRDQLALRVVVEHRVPAGADLPDPLALAADLIGRGARAVGRRDHAPAWIVGIGAIAVRGGTVIVVVGEAACRTAGHLADAVAGVDDGGEVRSRAGAAAGAVAGHMIRQMGKAGTDGIVTPALGELACFVVVVLARLAIRIGDHCQVIGIARRSR